MTLRALVLDFDGLILDTETSAYDTVRAEYEAHGLDLPLSAWQDLVGRVDKPHWVDRLEVELGRPLEDRDVLRQRRLEAHHRLVEAEQVRPGVIALLDAAAARDVPVAVASSSPESWVGGHLDRLGLLDRFTAVCCGDHVERTKPWPDVFLAALDAVGAEPAAAVALEDSHHGAQAAKAAGMACVVAPNDITRDQDFRHVDLVVGSLADLGWDQLVGLVRSGGPGRARQPGVGSPSGS